MNNRYIFYMTIFSLFLVSSCTKQIAYLPKENENVGGSAYGSFVSIETKNKQEIEGEFMAVKDSTLVVRIHSRGEIYDSKYILKVNYNDIKKMKLRYINQEGNSMYLIPASTITHGFWLTLTFPINLLTVIGTKKNSEIYSTYTLQSIKFDDLYKFSRFPQGLPENFIILNK